MNGSDSIRVDEERVLMAPSSLKCPHCGSVDCDAWEQHLQDDWTAIECGACERTYAARRQESVTYYSAPLEGQR